MKYLLAATAIALLVFQTLGLAVFLFGLWAFWRSWCLVFEPDTEWLQEAERQRMEGLVPERSLAWNNARQMQAHWYGTIGLMTMLLGVWLLAIGTA